MDAQADGTKTRVDVDNRQQVASLFTDETVRATRIVIEGVPAGEDLSVTFEHEDEELAEHLADYINRVHPQ